MTRSAITESSVHYAMAFLERYNDKYPSKKHRDTLKDLRDLSNKLLETLEQPFTVNIIRHNLPKQ